jgi:hypothetical protein
MRTANILDGKPERKRQLQRAGHRWEDNIKMNCKEIQENVDKIHTTQDRVQCSNL